MAASLSADLPLVDLQLTITDNPIYPPGVTNTIAPLFYGYSIQLFLGGIVAGQVYRFYYVNATRNRLDSALVAAVTVLSVISMAGDFIWPSDLFVTNYGRPISVLSFVNVGTTFNYILQACIAALCQGYFARRAMLLWDSKLYIAAPLVVGVLFSFGAGLAMEIVTIRLLLARELIYSPLLVSLAAWHWISAAVVDAVISIAICIPLIRAKRSLTIQTDTQSILAKLIRLSFTTAMGTTALAALLAGFARSSIPINALAPFYIQPRLYAISMLFVMNSREELVAAASGSGASHYSIKSPSRSRFGTRTLPDDIDRTGQCSGIAVQLETVHHIDVEAASSHQEKDSKRGLRF